VTPGDCRSKFNHDRVSRTRSFTASQVVNSSGYYRKCAMRRSSSAMISRATGTS